LVSFAYAWGKLNIFILLSIKTRIETRDLGLGTFNQMHQMKAETYARAYQNTIASAISRMRVGTDTDTGSLLITSGRITR
jgi:hypothetical protein